MKIKKFKIILIALVIAIITWTIESVVDFLVFFETSDFLSNLIYIHGHELWVRSVYMSMILLFSIYLQLIINKLLKTTEKLQVTEIKITEAYNRLDFYKDLFFHDINNVFQHILTSVELCDKYKNSLEASEKLEELSDIVKEQVLRGAKLISNIRKISKIESESPPLQTINIKKLLEKSINLLNITYKEREIKIQVDTLSDEFYFQGNELFQDVCENILLNSIKHNDNLIPEILIKISEETINEKSYIKTVFIDNGVGIEDSRKKLIFLRGFNEDLSTTGMGFGLSLVKTIIDSYNGKIWVEDRVLGDYSQGSKFIILLPKVIENN